MNLRDKRIVLTGASSGIGRALAVDENQSRFVPYAFADPAKV